MGVDQGPGGVPRARQSNGLLLATPKPSRLSGAIGLAAIASFTVLVPRLKDEGTVIDVDAPRPALGCRAAL